MCFQTEYKQGSHEREWTCDQHQQRATFSENSTCPNKKGKKKQQTQWPNSSWTFAPCRWVRMQTRFLFIGVSEFAADTSASVRSTASGHAVPVRVTCGTVTRMMAAHDESESSRQRDGWKEDRQRRAGLPQALDDSNSVPKKKSLYIVLIKPAHFLINWALNWFA